ncbi:thiolase domain-containing protein [Candidatus Peregrinibacteria bacterium]|jgi:acetyl-CoA C-acetyltransferase|nr:thiolase domain-containing protein [Candidatus Peregrinibacteria bacterium]MBT3598580.1 thiolase domain-containing protein [Candidatus Peregrinibacteria bacterium]MBT4366885.1 thiolase domain-containing protein [Candidatus Peregrinibacteria bacterium]MBT4586100.1 thiolase domain-containing protein [Candidatus Peregrinibacteria bacterium]MBT6730575.1 thiolase domain-containing protein [Candidatus Peregrinibacteria bacterium]
MEKAIYIAGTGMTPFGEWWDKSIRELMDEAVEKALESAECNALDIDTIIVANMLAESTSNQAHLGPLAANLLPHAPPALRVESACASGAIAMHTACGLLESGRSETILVIGVEKMTDIAPSDISTALMGAADAEKDAPCGLTFPGIFGLVASSYMNEYGLTREDLSLVSSRHHANAAKNPYAQFRNQVTPENVTNSTKVADPLRMLDCSPISDGAAACILSTKFASSFRLAASQIATDSVSITDRASLTSFPATKDAMSKALKEAEIERDEINHIEIHDCFSIAAVINVEDLGFAEAGKGINAYKKENSSLTINASGGLKACGHPVGATGVKQIIDSVKQLHTSKKQFALTQNFGGACASCAIHIIEQV